MVAPPKRDQLPVIQLLVLGIMGTLILIALLRPSNPPTFQTPVKGTLTQGTNMYKVPSSKLLPSGSYAAGETVELIARNTAGDWYRITGIRGDGWVIAQFVTVHGDLSSVPVDDGPPIPADTPAPMPIPTTTLIFLSAANLVLGNVSIMPNLPLKCGVTSEFKIDVANLGSEDTVAEGQIIITDYWNGLEQASAYGTFPVVEAGKITTVSGLFLTVSTNVNEDHKLVISLNPSGAVPESTQADNSREFAYKLQPC